MVAERTDAKPLSLTLGLSRNASLALSRSLPELYSSLLPYLIQLGNTCINRPVKWLQNYKRKSVHDISCFLSLAEFESWRRAVFESPAACRNKAAWESGGSQFAPGCVREACFQNTDYLFSVFHSLSTQPILDVACMAVPTLRGAELSSFLGDIPSRMTQLQDRPQNLETGKTAPLDYPSL